jgi:V/A-type H+-transporting ATPase subunit E
MIETTSGIGDLLQRLRKDGVEAGQAEKQRILRDAEEQAAAVLAEAKNRAQEIVAAAEADAVAKHKQLDAELTLAARDFALRFAERVKKQTIEPLVKARVEQVLADGDALKQILVALLRDGTGGATITVSPETKSALEAYFAQELARKVEGGQVEIVSENGVTGFRLQRKGDSFTWDVTGEAVAAEVAALVEPSLRKYLQFGSTRG